MITGMLTLVLPAHNEEDNIHHVVREAVQILPRFVDSFEIIVVNDGSEDQTERVVAQLAESDERIRLVNHAENQGYGAALRSGFDASAGNWVMVMDSDRQFDIGDLVYLAPLTNEFDLVAGYRIQRNDPLYRTLFGKAFRLAMRVLFGIQLKDIDCAFKVIRGEMLRSLNLSSSGAMISTELMARWARIGGTWTQVGVHHYPRRAGQQSGGSLRVILRAMRDVPRLWLRLNRERKPSAVQQRCAESSPGLSPSGAMAIVGTLATILVVIALRLLRHK